MNGETIQHAIRKGRHQIASVAAGEVGMSIAARWRPVLCRRALRLLLTRLLAGEQLSSDAIREQLQPQSDVGWRWLGSSIKALIGRELIRVTGLERSRFAECHWRNVPVWGIADATVARAWLVDHPELPGPQSSLLFPDFAKAQS